MLMRDVSLAAHVGLGATRHVHRRVTVGIVPAAHASKPAHRSGSNPARFKITHAGVSCGALQTGGEEVVGRMGVIRMDRTTNPAGPGAELGGRGTEPDPHEHLTDGVRVKTLLASQDDHQRLAAQRGLRPLQLPRGAPKLQGQVGARGRERIFELLFVVHAANIPDVHAANKLRGGASSQ